MRIVIPGGSGHIGSLLAQFFHQHGHQVTVLTRSPYAAPWQTVLWDGSHAGPWVEVLEGADVCLHLSGRSINCRATANNRRELYDSRIGPTRLLGHIIAGLSRPPRVWLNASTATIYRHALDRSMDEAGEIGGNESLSAHRRAPEKWNWTVKLVKDWEAAFFDVPLTRTRKIALRTSLVFAPQPGSIFAVLSHLTRLGLGGTQGNGRQYVSWIHEADFARAVAFLIDHETLSGPVNLAAPHPVPNREFMAILREAWNRPNGVPAPAWIIAIGAALLRTESELVLKSRRVTPAKLLEAGFDFEFPDWAPAAEDLVRRWREREA
jgi:uncharacterized protein